MTRRVTPCPCGHETCRDWHVSPEADVQSVSFTEEQARAVAALLDAMDGLETPAPTEPGWYYARQRGFERVVPTLVEKRLYPRDLIVPSQTGAAIRLSEFTWFGPVPTVTARG